MILKSKAIPVLCMALAVTYPVLAQDIMIGASHGQ